MMEATKVTPLPKILVNSVPKSGTNLLIQSVLGIPYITIGKTMPPGGVYVHNFASLQGLQNGEMTYSHLLYRPELQDRLKEWGIKQVFVSRDLRDIIVSMAHFILDKFHQHPLYPYFTECLSTHEERLLALIEGVDHPMIRHASLYEEFKEIYDWIETPGVCCVTFENLVRDRGSHNRALTKIVNFLWEDLQELRLRKRDVARMMKQNVNPLNSWSFRRGKIGGWRDEFNEKHKAAFKEVTGDFLIRLGYEKDMNW